MTVDLSAPPPAGAVAKTTLLTGTRSFIVGLGGALAGISAILYACGYLVTRAHLSLLGLYGLIEFNNDYILQEGAKFFLVNAYSSGRGMVLPWLTLLIPSSLIGIALADRLRERAMRAWNAVRARYLHVDALPFARALAFIVLFALFLLHSGVYLAEFERPLCYANLLYADGGLVNCGAADPNAEDKLLAALFGIPNKRLLKTTFDELITGLAEAILIAFLTWRVTLPWRWRAWCVAPPFFAAALYMLLLPMDYGVLQRSINYPRIAMTLEGKSAFDAAGPLFLLNKSSGDFVVWDAASRKLFWVPISAVKRAEIDGAYDLFDARWYKYQPRGGKK